MCMAGCLFLFCYHTTYVAVCNGRVLQSWQLVSTTQACETPCGPQAAYYLAMQVRMGFPQRNEVGRTAQVFVGAQCNMQDGGHTCPRCKALVAELPCNCHVCGLTLVSSSQLARSYHHLFPVPQFTEVSAAQMHDAEVGHVLIGTGG